jgi:putative ABC transport system permease protein
LIKKIRNDLKEKIIVDKFIIKKIRKDIEKENENMDKKAKAFLFSNEIKKLCNQEIKDFKYKDEILKELLNKLIIENKLDCDDVYDKVLNRYENDDEFSLDMSNFIRKNTEFKNIKIEDELKINFNRSKMPKKISKENKNIVDLRIDKEYDISNKKSNKNFSNDFRYENTNDDFDNKKLDLKTFYVQNKPDKKYELKNLILVAISIFIVISGFILIKPLYMKDDIIIEIDEIDPYEYKEFDHEKLKIFLKEKESLLAQDIYFNQIISASKKKNLNPIILFAIASHEQGYVKEDHPDAKQIINNPFNVFYSWKKYNTSLEDSSTIAARTVYNLSLNRPKEVDYFKWINRKYAQDQNWHKGVSWIFNKMEEVIKTDKEEK